LGLFGWKEKSVSRKISYSFVSGLVVFSICLANADISSNCLSQCLFVLTRPNISGYWTFFVSGWIVWRLLSKRFQIVKGWVDCSFFCYQLPMHLLLSHLKKIGENDCGRKIIYLREDAEMWKQMSNRTMNIMDIEREHSKANLLVKRTELMTVHLSGAQSKQVLLIHFLRLFFFLDTNISIQNIV